ncbi:hypothetical protein TSAR_012560 [Trichomalopsis sarcophagae]|uniref:Deltamethrin resistance protein prag01 domain-containing protein n=1 Tax=Trichomalopsis sarcophagae TaxID=543379 RepID=A0A232F7M1_9HYME|nr:hypothetical protein TSAR_012560 [Trichomalopsis sarcophagae]
MTWKTRGISLFRQGIGGRVLKSLSTRQKCETKAQQGVTDCCQAKSLMDETTHPEGSWSKNYKRWDAHNNQMLFIGLTTFIVTAIVLKRTDVAKGYPDVTLF